MTRRISLLMFAGRLFLLGGHTVNDANEWNLYFAFDDESLRKFHNTAFDFLCQNWRGFEWFDYKKYIWIFSMYVLNVQNRPYAIGEWLGRYLKISSQTNTYPDFFRIGAGMRSRLGSASGLNNYHQVPYQRLYSTSKRTGVVQSYLT